MFDFILKDKKTRNFAIISIVISAIMFIVENINGRFWLNDFKVMYMAAEAFLNGEQIYGVSFGLSTGFYKYSPFTLLLFTPYTLVSYKIASIIHFIIITFSAITTIIILEKMINKYLIVKKKNSYLVLLAILLCVILHLVRELHLGNVNMILIFLYVLALKFLLENKNWGAGLLLAIIIFTKPYFIICVLPLFLFKKFKTCISLVVSGIVFLLGTVMIIGFSDGIILFKEWFSAMLAHSGYLISHHTVFSLMNHYLGFAISSSYSLPLLGVISILSVLYFWWINNNKDKGVSLFCDNNKMFIIHFFLLISIVPNLLITDTEHFLFSLPLISILIIQINNSLKRKMFVILIFAVLMFMYGGNSSDLLGSNLSGKFDEYGILGISNLMIIGTVLYLFRRSKRLKQ